MRRFTGFPSPASECERPPLSLDSLLIRFPLATMFVRFKGDAMSGFGINHDDLLVVERCQQYPPGIIVLAFVDNNRIVRQLERFSSGLVLCPANQRYKTIQVTEQTEIFGRVLYSITQYLKITADLLEAF
jgi:SOS-response transcriptional repressor LexA